MTGVPQRVIIRAFIVLALSGCGSADSVAPPTQNPAQQPVPSIVSQVRPAESPTSGHDLAADEALGGHTLQRHVGKSDAELIERLRREPQISSASTYTDRATAESVVGAALGSDNRAFTSWRERTGRRPNFVLRYRADRVIGRSVMRGGSQSVPCVRAVIVLRWDEGRQRFYVLTSYQEASR
ncbi:MAG TPA: RNase A-like domain-containing protein [Vicinamibacterales bacterium]|nr:RNase A-like domain-containing protein [Vicinamibacterales bacterium]